jgi:hypothetical protein
VDFSLVKFSENVVQRIFFSFSWNIEFRGDQFFEIVISKLSLTSQKSLA